MSHAKIASVPTSTYLPIQPLESRWRMPGFFAGAVLTVAAALSSLSLVADPAGVTYGLAPVWPAAYTMMPVAVAQGVMP
jgi:hypothetical protein